MSDYLPSDMVNSLVSGYIHNIQNVLTSSIINFIPDVIHKLCSKYYGPFSKKEYLILITGSNYQERKKLHQINMVNLTNHSEKYKFNVMSLDNINNITEDVHFDRFTYAHCFLPHIKLPQYVISKYMENDNYTIKRHQYYNVLYRIGGSVQNPYISCFDRNYEYNICDMIFFQTPIGSKADAIDAFHVYLPKVPGNPIISGSHSIYDEIYNTMLSYAGGNYEHTKHLYKFDLNTMEHSRIDNVIKDAKCRSSVSVCKVRNNDKLFMAIIGGYRAYHKPPQFDSIELYSVYEKKYFDNLKPLNIPRSDAGSYYMEHNNNIIVVGGSYSGNKGNDTYSAKKSELYDINKDVWINIKAECIYSHQRKPLIYEDAYNYNIIYVVGDKMTWGNCTNCHKYSGQMEWIDLREGIWNKSYTKDLESLTSLFDRSLIGHTRTRGLYIL